MKIAGVSLGTSFDTVKASLGQPTSENVMSLPMDALILSTLIIGGSMDILDIIAITFAVYSLNIMVAR